MLNKSIVKYVHDTLLASATELTTDVEMLIVVTSGHSALTVPCAGHKQIVFVTLQLISTSL